MTVGLAKSVHAVSSAAPPGNASSPTSTAVPAPSPFPTPSPSAPAAEREFPALTQHEAIQGGIYAFITILLGWVPLIISILKGKWKMLATLFAFVFVLGFLGVGTREERSTLIALAVTYCCIVFAIRLAKPWSWWAKRFYTKERGAEHKMALACKRFLPQTQPYSPQGNEPQPSQSELEEKGKTKMSSHYTLKEVSAMSKEEYEERMDESRRKPGYTRMMIFWIRFLGLALIAELIAVICYGGWIRWALIGAILVTCIFLYRGETTLRRFHERETRRIEEWWEREGKYDMEKENDESV
jgi:hypothetical protein